MKWLSLIFILLPSLGYAKSYWIVQNIGTLTLRAYEKECDTCTGKMILETPMIVGKNEIDPLTQELTQTQLGFFTIEKWHKFYVDGKESYIRWDGRKLPKRGKGRKDWGWQGAFGVYTATLIPHNFQHLHGTIGWPNESARFLEHEKQPDGTIKRVGSHGCTRVDNQAIMFMRNIIPEGTPVIRIYAKEVESNKNKIANYNKWTYVFYETPDRNVSNPLDYYNRKFVGENHILEVGDYNYKTTPQVQPLKMKKDWNLKEINGNPYEVEDKDLKGYLNIDTGLVSNDYTPPKTLTVKGLEIPSNYKEPSSKSVFK